MNCMFYKISKVYAGNKKYKCVINRVYPVYARGKVFLMLDDNQADRLNRIFSGE